MCRRSYKSIVVSFQDLFEFFFGVGADQCDLRVLLLDTAVSDAVHVADICDVVCVSHLAVPDLGGRPSKILFVVSAE
jgi:hypothetical protein